MESVKYLSLAGGGIKGIMYIGMIRALSRHIPFLYSGLTYTEWLQTMDGFAGSSIGALTALTMLLNLDTYKVDELMRPMLENLQSVVPRPDITGLFTNYGLDDGSSLRNIIERVLSTGGLSPKVTFLDLKRLLQKDFVVTATNAHTQTLKLFSADTTPHASVGDAIYMSMTLPFLFEPMRYEGELMLDGGLSANVPRCFPIDSTLFIDFDCTQRYIPINTFTDFLQCVLNTTIDSDTTHRQYKTLWLVSPLHIVNEFGTNFNLTTMQVIMRVNCGYASGLQFLYPNFIRTIVLVLQTVYESYLELACSPLGFLDM